MHLPSMTPRPAAATAAGLSSAGTAGVMAIAASGRIPSAAHQRVIAGNSSDTTLSVNDEKGETSEDGMF